MPETVFNEGSIDGTDFRIESDDNANMFFVDGADDRIGIGVNSPTTTLNISKATTSTDGGVYPSLKIENTSAGSGNSYANIVLHGGNGTTQFSILNDGRSSNSAVTLRTDSSSPINFLTNGSTAFVLGTSQQATFSGAVYIPEYIYHDGDTNTHFRMRADEIILTAGGNNLINMGTTEVAINHDQQNIDFRVESDSDDYALFVDASSSRVGINTNTPARVLTLTGASNTDGIRLLNTGYDYYNEICNNGDGLIFRVDPGTAGGSGVDFRWTINDDEKMRLVQSGRLGINATSPNARLHVNEGTNGQELIYLDHTASGEQTMILFKTEGSTRGTIKSDNSPSQTAYNTSSDERLKENIVEVDDALSIVNKIPVKQFNFIEDKNKTPLIGYIGQELVKEYPRAVSVTKTDEYDDHYMVDQSKMVAVLMKAVQELSVEVEDLKKKNVMRFGN